MLSGVLAEEQRSEGRQWRVEVIGLGSAGLFHLERLTLSADVRVVAAVDEDPKLRVIAAGLGCPVFETSKSVIGSGDVDAMVFCNGVSPIGISAALNGGRHVVVQRPWLLSSDELSSLHDDAVRLQRVATPTCLRRWSADFASVLAAIHTGRVGSLQSARFCSFEQSLTADVGSAGTLREFGYHWLDQLLLIAESTPRRVFAKTIGDQTSQSDRGFLVVIEFSNGCLAQIDVNTGSRLGYHTGWMLEGSLGSYRNDKLYTVAPDGEIVDEPLRRTPDFGDHFIDALVSSWNGNATTLPTLKDAACVVRLIEAIEESIATGMVTPLQSVE